MYLRNKITTGQMNYKENTFFRRGVLNLPLIIMLPFGLLGFRPGQLFNKIVGYFINTMFLFNYCLILAVAIARFCNVKNDEYERTHVKFFTGFAVFMTVKFTILIYIYFKRFNFIHLLEDITKIRKYSLSKIELTFVTMQFTTVVTMVIYLIYFVFNQYVIPVLTTGVRPFEYAFKYNGPLQARVTIILEFLIYMNNTWISILATSFIINVISVVLRREFDKCVEILQEKIDKTETLTGDKFSETVERFQELIGMVDKVDDMFFLDFTLNLFASLGMLCSAIYGIYVRDFTFKDMTLQILVSIVTLLVTLPASAALQSKVRPTFNNAFFNSLGTSHLQYFSFCVLHFIIKFYNLRNKFKQSYFLGSQYCSSSTELQTKQDVRGCVGSSKYGRNLKEESFNEILCSD